MIAIERLDLRPEMLRRVLTRNSPPTASAKPAGQGAREARLDREVAHVPVIGVPAAIETGCRVRSERPPNAPAQLAAMAHARKFLARDRGRSAAARQHDVIVRIAQVAVLTNVLRAELGDERRRQILPQRQRRGSLGGSIDGATLATARGTDSASYARYRSRY